MKRIVLPILLCPLLTWATPQPPRTADIAYLSTTIDEALALASAKNKKLFVRFTADWCLPCQWMEQNTFPDPQLSKDLSDGFITLILDVDSYTGFREKEAYSITTLPTLLVLNGSGDVLLRLERTIGALELRELLHQLPDGNGSPANAPVGLSPSQGTTHLSKSRLIPTQNSTSVTPAPASQLSARIYGVEIALFSQYERAIPYVTKLERQLADQVSIIVNDQDYERTIYHIVVGRVSSSREANQLQSRLANVGLKGQIKDLSEL